MLKSNGPDQPGIFGGFCKTTVKFPLARPVSFSPPVKSGPFCRRKFADAQGVFSGHRLAIPDFNIVGFVL
jgi:hypothetical protein